MAMVAMVVMLVLLHLGWEPPGMLRWINSYLDDFLFLPLVLCGVLVALRLARKEAGWTVPLRLGLGAVLAYTMYFEGVLPRFTTRATGDPRDVVAYVAGLLFFTFVINRPANAGE